MIVVASRDIQVYSCLSFFDKEGDNHDPDHEHFCVQIKTINNDGV